MVKRITEFPTFCPIDISLKSEIDELTKRHDKYSDFSFVNLYTWDTNEKAGVSILNSNLIIRIPDYQELDKNMYTFIGDHKLDETVAILLEDFKELELIPGFMVTLLDSPEKYAISEDRDSFDYVYRATDLAEMKGKKLSKKRNHINVITKQLGGRVRFTTTSSLTDKEIRAIRKVIDSWSEDESKLNNSSRFERIALDRLFDNWDHFGLQITLCYLDDALNGFTIYEVNEDMSVCHFEKCLNDPYDSLGTLLVQEAARQLIGKSLLVNWEQDLGIPGLKKSKLSYKPLTYMRKYKINLGSTLG